MASAAYYQWRNGLNWRVVRLLRIMQCGGCGIRPKLAVESYRQGITGSAVGGCDQEVQPVCAVAE